MNKEINEIINNLEQTLGWCDRITTGNLPHKIGNLKQCLVSTIELLKVLNLGWHPASELPPEEGEYITIMSNSLGEHGEICYNDFSNGEWRYIGYDWEPRKVLLWCYPPKED